MRTQLLLVVALLALSACSDDGSGGAGDDHGTEASSAQSSGTLVAEDGPEPLPSGKSLLELDQGVEYASPDGFSPELRITIPGPGWNTTHRSADAFDIGRPVPGQDAALVVVAFLQAAEESAASALDTVSQQAQQAGAAVEQDGDTLHVTGGAGPLVASADGGVALDAVPDGYATIEATDSTDGPLLTVMWVPDAANRDQADPLAGQLVAGVVGR